MSKPLLGIEDTVWGIYTCGYLSIRYNDNWEIEKTCGTNRYCVLYLSSYMFHSLASLLILNGESFVQ